MTEPRKRLLLVEDEAMLRSTMRGHFEDFGYVVLEAASGEEGVELLQSERVDYAIVDMRLPRMDGNDFILKAHEMQPGLRVLVHTGSVGYSPPPAVMAVGVGEDHVFAKPLHDLDVLVQALKAFEAEE